MNNPKSLIASIFVLIIALIAWWFFGGGLLLLFLVLGVASFLVFIPYMVYTRWQAKKMWDDIPKE